MGLSQTEQIISVMRQNGGYATLKRLNELECHVNNKGLTAEQVEIIDNFKKKFEILQELFSE